METSITTRPMQKADLPSILDIQARCYTSVAPESESSLISKLNASPSTCFVACQQERVVGYLFAIPACFENPPELDAQTCILPADPDSLYLHDLSVDTSARRSGAGRALVEKFIEKIDDLEFNRASLIAVQDSRSYWERFSFRCVSQSAALKAKLSSYGENIEYMERIS